jgi:hypothetical protein
MALFLDALIPEFESFVNQVLRIPNVWIMSWSKLYVSACLECVMVLFHYGWNVSR